MPASIAIRLGVEGGAEVKRALDDAGRAGQAAFQGVGAAADAAGAATDRQVAKFQRLAQAAREAEAQARAQANVNALLGVGAGSAGSARDSASAFEDALARQDQVEAARRAQAAQNAQTSLNQILGIREAQVGAARASAGAFEEAYRQEAEALKRTADLRTAAIRNASTGWRDLSAAGTLALANIEASRRLGSLGVGPQAANENARLRPDQVQNLLYQGGDVLAQVGSGSPLGMIAFQQGPQIAQTFAGPGGASVKGALTQAGEAVSSFVARIGLVGGAIGGVTAAVLTGAAAWASYRGSQKEVDQQLSGIGRASGATAGQVNAIALATARSAGVSVSSAREMAGEFASTGRIGEAMYAGLIGISRDYALTTRQELPDATKTLADAFADPVRGAEMLNAQLGFLDATTKETIERLGQQGNRLGAQKALFDAMGASVAGAREKLGFFARQWEGFKQTTSDEFDAIGRFIDRGLGGGDAEGRLKVLQGQLAFRQRNMGAAGGIFDGLLGFDVETIRKQIAEVQAEIDKAAKAGSAASLAQRGLQVDSIVRSLNPGAEALKQMEDRAEQIRRFLADGGLDKDGSSRRTMDSLTASAKTLREDLIAGGTAFAASIRDAQFNLRTVGFSESGRNVAAIAQRAESAIRDLPASADREAQIASIRERQRLETEATQRSYLIQPGAFATSLRDVPEQYRTRLQSAADAQGVDPSLLASIFYRESRFRPEVIDGRVLSSAGAAGAFQFMPGTARQYGVDPLDFDSAAGGAARLIADRLRARNGDTALALADYNWGQGNVDRVGGDVSRFPRETREYIANIMRQTPGTGERVQDLEGNARALALANDNLRANTDLYGRNGLQLDAQTRANQMLSEQLARGVPLTDALRNSILQFADQSATAAQKMRLVQFASDSTFDREQLGRSQVDQAAFARARAVVGDTTSPAAQMVIETSRMNDNLRETRNLATDAFGGMLTSLRQGATFMDAMSNAAGRFADRILSVAADRAVASLFGGGASGSGGILGLLGLGGGSADSGLPNLNFGFSGGGYTGPGGKYDPAGVVHRGEYVFDAAATSRIGVDVLESMRRGGSGYADGGYTMPRGSAMRPAGGNLGLNVVINEAPGGDQAQTRVERGPNGDPRLVVDLISRQQAADIAQGRGPLAASAGGGRRLRG